MTMPPDDAARRDPVADALRKLDAALTRLEAAAIRRLDADAAPDDRDVELALMNEDRARLASALDAASARLAQVEANAGEVGQRLDRAITAVAGVLERH
jgi:hypothetical protein